MVKGVAKRNYFYRITLTSQNSLIWLHRASLTLKFNEFCFISCNLYHLKLITAECKYPSVGDTRNKHISLSRHSVLIYPNWIFWSLLWIPVTEQWYFGTLPPFRNIKQNFGKVNCKWMMMSAPRLVFDLLHDPSLKLYKKAPHLCGGHLNVSCLQWALTSLLSGANAKFHLMFELWN